MLVSTHQVCVYTLHSGDVQEKLREIEFDFSTLGTSNTKVCVLSVSGANGLLKSSLITAN